MARTLQDWMNALTPLLAGINCYNPVHIDTLEQFVQFQASDPNAYDFEANLVLLKLYQFMPNRFNLDITCKILMKSIMALPNTHLSMLLSVLPLNQQSNEHLLKISELGNCLESCQFSKFWSVIEDHNEYIDKVAGFKEAIKKYIIDLINTSYQTISVELLKAYLGQVTDEELSVIIEANTWRIEGEFIFIRGQEEVIKPKRILAKIDFENVGNIVTA